MRMPEMVLVCGLTFVSVRAVEKIIFSVQAVLFFFAKL